MLNISTIQKTVYCKYLVLARVQRTRNLQCNDYIIVSRCAVLSATLSQVPPAWKSGLPDRSSHPCSLDLTTRASISNCCFIVKHVTHSLEIPSFPILPCPVLVHRAEPVWLDLVLQIKLHTGSKNIIACYNLGLTTLGPNIKQPWKMSHL